VYITAIDKALAEDLKENNNPTNLKSSACQ
jgi:hypothetical protein